MSASLILVAGWLAAGVRSVEEAGQDRASGFPMGFGSRELTHLTLVASVLRNLAYLSLVPGGVCDLAAITDVTPGPAQSLALQFQFFFQDYEHVDRRVHEISPSKLATGCITG
jgi:energy-converting hydrogenase Eha subunit G